MNATQLANVKRLTMIHSLDLDDQNRAILDLEEAALNAGDSAQGTLCFAAINGNASARGRCLDAIARDAHEQLEREECHLIQQEKADEGLTFSAKRAT